MDVRQVGFDNGQVCRRPVEFWRVGFYYYKRCWRPVKVREMLLTAENDVGCPRFVEYVLTAVGVIRLGFDCRKVCRRPVDVWRVSFYYHKGYWKPVVVQRFAFNCHKACRKPVEVRRVCVDCCRGCKSRF